MPDFSWTHADEIETRNAEIAKGPIAEPPPKEIVLPAEIAEREAAWWRLRAADCGPVQ